MEELLARWGALAVLVGAALEGDGTMILGGVVAHLGLVRAPLVVAAGAAGALLGDVGWFLLGRTGARAGRRRAAGDRVLGAVERLAVRVGLWQVVLARFVYGTRIASMIFWGSRGVPLGRFVAVDLVGAIVWAAALGALGYFLSNSAAALLGEVRRVEEWLLGAVVVVVVSGLLVRTMNRRRLAGGT